MRTLFPVKILRLHFNEGDRHQGKPLHEAIVAKCRELKVAGITVFRGLEGYGESAEIHRRHMVGKDQPMVAVIVETPENVQRILPVLEDMMDNGLIAISDAEAIRVERTSARTAG